jgi:hypothetical protein
LNKPKRWIAIEVADKCEDCSWSSIRWYQDEALCTLFQQSVFKRWDGKLHTRKCDPCIQAGIKLAKLIAF